jgi:hypothetical protein
MSGEHKMSYLPLHEQSGYLKREYIPFQFKNKHLELTVLSLGVIQFLVFTNFVFSPNLDVFALPIQSVTQSQQQSVTPSAQSNLPITPVGQSQQQSVTPSAQSNLPITPVGQSQQQSVTPPAQSNLPATSPIGQMQPPPNSLIVTPMQGSPVPPSSRIIVMTDKPTYAPEESIRISGTMGQVNPGTPITVSIYDASGSSLFDSLDVNNGPNANAFSVVDQRLQSGIETTGLYNVVVKQGIQTGETKFSITEIATEIATPNDDDKDDDKDDGKDDDKDDGKDDDKDDGKDDGKDCDKDDGKDCDKDDGKDCDKDDGKDCDKDGD